MTSHVEPACVCWPRCQELSQGRCHEPDPAHIALKSLFDDGLRRTHQCALQAVSRWTASSGLAPGDTATLRAKIRWLAGWPELLFRLRGNWVEMPARLTLPTNLGTPGLPNSRRVDNAGPAIYDVTHLPALPRANQTVTVTCRVSRTRVRSSEL